MPAENDVIPEKKRRMGHSVWEMATSSRYVLAYMLFMGIILVFAMRASFAVVLVAITSTKNETVSDDKCSPESNRNSSDAKTTGESYFFLQFLQLQFCIASIELSSISIC